MDQTVLSGLFALGGAIIGGLVTIGATVISNKKQVKLELKKQRIDFLNDKRNALENFSTKITTFIMNPDNGLRIGEIYNLFYLTAHYLEDEPDFGKLNKTFSGIINNIKTDIDNLSYDEINQLTDISNKIQILLRNKLCRIMKELVNEMTI